MSYGTAAEHASAKLNGLLDSKDDKVVAAAFTSLSSVSKVENAALQKLFGTLNSSGRVLKVIKKRPEKFIQTLPRYKAMAIPYLRAIAFAGKLDVKPVKASAEPDVLSIVGGAKSKTRVAACRALAEIRLDSSVEILLEVLKVADMGAGSKRDEKSITAILKAVGRIGMNTPEVRAALDKYKAEFPDIVEKSVESLK